jgi:very-short-patch-repair endonuclease
MTRAEQAVERSLVKAGVLYRPQWVMEPWIVDFYLPDFGVVLEVDGDSHIGRENKDWTRTVGLKKRRDVNRVARVTNEQAKEGINLAAILRGDHDHQRPPEYLSPKDVQVREQAALREAHQAALDARPAVIIRRPR